MQLTLHHLLTLIKEHSAQKIRGRVKFCIEGDLNRKCFVIQVSNIQLSL